MGNDTFDIECMTDTFGHWAGNNIFPLLLRRERKDRPVFGKREPPRAGTLSPAGPHDNNKDQFDFGSKMQK